MYSFHAGWSIIIPESNQRSADEMSVKQVVRSGKQMLHGYKFNNQIIVLLPVRLFNYRTNTIIIPDGIVFSELF
jgi:hypothetical protein